MTSEHVQKANLSLRDWEKAHKCEHSTLPWGKQTGGCQYLGRIERQHASLRIPPEGKEECGAGISIEKV